MPLPGCVHDCVSSPPLPCRSARVPRGSVQDVHQAGRREHCGKAARLLLHLNMSDHEAIAVWQCALAQAHVRCPCWQMGTGGNMVCSCTVCIACTHHDDAYKHPHSVHIAIIPAYRKTGQAGLHQMSRPHQLNSSSNPPAGCLAP